MKLQTTIAIIAGVLSGLFKICTGQTPRRTNFCALREKVENSEIARREALRGLNLSVALFNNQVKNGTGKIDEENNDVGVLFLDELAKRAGFHWRDNYQILHIPNENQTYTEIITDDNDKHKYDIIGDWTVREPERLNKRLVFPVDWFDASIIMVRKYNDLQPQWFLLLQPFPWTVWLMIFGTVIGSAFIIYLISYIDYRRKKKSMDAGFTDNIFLAAFAFVGQALYEPVSSAQRISVFSLALLSLFTVSVYIASLTDQLINSKVVIQDIQDGIRAHETFCFPTGTNIQSHMEAYYPKSSRRSVESAMQCFQDVIDDKCQICLTTVSEWDTYKQNDDYNKDCQLHQVGEQVSTFSGGFCFVDIEEYCTSLLYEVLSIHFFDLKLNHTHINIWEKARESKKTNSCDVDRVESDAINTQDVALIFIIHLAFTIFAISYSGIKYCIHTRKEKRRVDSGYNSDEEIPLARDSDYSKVTINFGHGYKDRTSLISEPPAQTDSRNSENLLQDQGMLQQKVTIMSKEMNEIRMNLLEHMTVASNLLDRINSNEKEEIALILGDKKM